MMDRSQWTGQGVSEPATPPSLSQMLALARRMGYEMWPIARWANQLPGSPRTPFASGQGYRPPFRQGRDFSKIKRDICKLAAPSWIRRYRSSHRVGTCSRIISNSGTPIPHRETPFRPGPHPNRSECHSSGLLYIIINRLNTTDIILWLISFNYNSHRWFRQENAYGFWITILQDWPVPP